MANSKILDTKGKYAYATVNADPGANGYFTDEIAPRRDKIDKLFFSIRETDPEDSSTPPASVATVTLQFKCNRQVEWQDFVPDNTLSIGSRIMIEENGTGVLWRAGVKDGNYTSGSITFGFDW